MRPPHTAFTLAFFLAACQPAEGDLTWEGEHLLVTSKEGVELCGGSIAFLEAYAVHISNYWATTDPPAPLELELRQSGDEFLGGASYDRSAWAGSEISVLHEINHMITRSHDGASAPSLAEGIATAIAPRDPASMWGPAYGAGFAAAKGRRVGPPTPTACPRGTTLRLPMPTRPTPRDTSSHGVSHDRRPFDWQSPWPRRLQFT